MNSESIFMDTPQFKRFVKSMGDIGLKRKPKDGSNFPLDFVVYYRNRFTLNFEYLSGNLHFYLINGTGIKKKQIPKNYNPVLSEIKKKINSLIQ